MGKATDDHVHENGEVQPSAPKKAPFYKRAMTKLGSEKGTFVAMLKGALPPAIAIAIYQADGVVSRYLTVGYLIAISSVLGFALLPRAKFIQTIFLNALAACVGTAMNLLMIYSSVQARKHTSPSQPTSQGPTPKSATAPYNSSASAVCAIWLFFNVYISNAIRGKLPAFQFSLRILECFLTGFGIAFGVSLFVIPVNCRLVWFKEATGFIGQVKAALATQGQYLEALATIGSPRDQALKGPKVFAQATIEARKLRAIMTSITGLFGTMYSDITFAKREVAYGHLHPHDIDEFSRLLQELMMPLIGLASADDMLHRLAVEKGWIPPVESDDRDRHIELNEQDIAEKEQWKAVAASLIEPYHQIASAMDDGLQHTMYLLKLAKKPRRSGDVEANIAQPGDPEFANQFSARIEELFKSRTSALREFCKLRGIQVKDKSFANKLHEIDLSPVDDQGKEGSERGTQRQLYLILQLEYLSWTLARSILKMVDFADRKVADGTMTKHHLILPGAKRMKKWLFSVFKHEDSGVDHTPDFAERGANIHPGASYATSKDPEHLPPANWWERITNYARKASHFLGSEASGYGFRVACATMSIAIISFLGPTQSFFLKQRVVWATIMIALGMTMTAGAGVLGFFARTMGTVIAMITSLVIWYIVDGHTAGVIVFLFVFTFIEFYFFVKYQQFLVMMLFVVITQVLIVGYELQVRKIGIKVSTATGQPFYPVYTLAPYRLATVAAGMAVACFWTFFPYPITARSQLRRDLGAVLHLTANYYSMLHTTIGLRLRGLEGDPADENSPDSQLRKSRLKCFSKSAALISSLRMNSSFTKWEPAFGGKFPREIYDNIIDEVERIMQYLGLVVFASKTFSHNEASDQRRLHDSGEKDDDADDDDESWLEAFSKLTGSVRPTGHEVVSTLSLLSASVSSGHPLPPYLKAPDAFALTKRLQEMDPEVLSATHLLEPGYSAFAVTQIATSLVSEDMTRLIDNVRKLVGEVDFSFKWDEQMQEANETKATKVD